MAHFCYVVSAMKEALHPHLKSIPMRNEKTSIVKEKNKQ
jgi:hypothetical protein